jgi:3-dehydrosphinganine reductase
MFGIRSTPDYYAGKRVLVVGGSKGIGRSLAITLARRGARVCIAARGEADLWTVAGELREATGRRHGHAVLDVTDAQGVLRARDGILAELGGLDVLVCGSGSARSACVFDAPSDDFRRMLEVNYLGHVNVVRAFAPTLVEQGHGDICLVSSIVAFVPIYGYAAYAASKAAIVAFAESLRQELKLHGVRVGVYYPPTTETPGLEEENRTKPAVVWKIESESGWNRVYSADAVAASIAEAIERGTAHGMIGFDSWLMRVGQRFAPGLFRRFADAEVRKAMRVESDEHHEPVAGFPRQEPSRGGRGTPRSRSGG